MIDHFGQGKSTGRALRGILVMIDRPVGNAGLRKMPSDQLRLRHLDGVLHHFLGDAQVNGAAPIAQQRSVGGVVHQRVPEGIGGARRLTVGDDDLGLRELGERVLQLPGRQGRQRLDQVE